MKQSYHTTNKAAEQSLISKLIVKYFPYWPLFLILSLVCLSAAFVYLRYATPAYEATATIIIKDGKKGYDDSKLLESLNTLSTKKIIENEIEVLQSRTLMENVVRKLNLCAPIFREGKVRTQSLYTAFPFTIAVADPDRIKEANKIYLRYDESRHLVQVANKWYPLNRWVRTDFGKLMFIQNRNFPDTVNKDLFYFSLIPIKKVVRNSLNALKVSASNKLSTVIDLSYRDEVAKKAEDVLNGLLTAYNEAAIIEKNSLAKSTQSFVEDRLGIVSHELDSIERQIQQYKSGKSAVDISTQGQLFLQNVSANDQKLSEVNMQLGVLSQVEKFVRSNESTGGIVPSTLGVNDPVLSQLLDKLYNYELEYERLRKTVAENNPMLVSLTDQINKIRPNILENIQSHRKSLEVSRGNLNSTNGSYNSVLQAIPAKERQLLEISREQAIKSNIYSFLLQKREESALSSSSTVTDGKIVDRAQASLFPVSPRPKIVYAGSVVLAFLLVIVLVNARETLNEKVLYRKEIEDMTNIPIIGELAYQRKGSPMLVEKGRRTFIGEEFRKLRVSLPFLGIGEHTKKILVTSSISGEGKSFIATNLAISLSLTGKKVVLVDMDLNNPSVHDIIQFNVQEGVSDYLYGDKEPEEIIKEIPDCENLFFISAGSLPESPTEVLANGKVKQLLNYLDSVFDFVLIDTAPVGPVTDAYIISPYCDATLYVIRHLYTPKQIIKRIDESQKITALVNPAIIFNGVKTRGYVKNSYGYGYGYVYDYAPTSKKTKRRI